jgi:hypothetical protein
MVSFMISPLIALQEEQVNQIQSLVEKSLQMSYRQTSRCQLSVMNSS